MPVEEAPEDDEVRQSYNFAPGYHGLVYRADVPDWGAGGAPQDSNEEADQPDQPGQPSSSPPHKTTQLDVPGETRYKLQKMKWGLVPFWTKRNPDYGTLMRTINARDDSLAAKGGMWASMKHKKRCIVVAQGFYEWLKKNGGKEKIPHYTKRKDGQLMCFAGLWDCVRYEDSDEKHYTYTIITTDSNQQLSFLHDRMPVILENGSDEIRTWLDPKRTEWSKDLQSLLKPFPGELECYPVTKDVSKVGNNSPSFLIPVASSENKNNIANFFGNAKKGVKSEGIKAEVKQEQEKDAKATSGVSVKKEDDEKRDTADVQTTEDNAPMPVPASSPPPPHGVKREHPDDDDGEDGDGDDSKNTKAVKQSGQQQASPPTKASSPPTPNRKTRSATNNNMTTSTATKASPIKSTGSQKITSFFNK